ncbi:MAG: hypothetical protein QOF97_2468 [Acidimicrobiaceae bacterium]
MDIVETVTNVQDQVLETTKTVQDQVIEYVRKAVERLDEVLPEDRPAVPFADSIPAPAELVERGFGIAEKALSNQSAFAKQVLEAQHQFAKAIVDAVSPLLPQAAPAPVAKPKAAKAA